MSGISITFHLAFIHNHIETFYFLPPEPQFLCLHTGVEPLTFRVMAKMRKSKDEYPPLRYTVGVLTFKIFFTALQVIITKQKQKPGPQKVKIMRIRAFIKEYMVGGDNRALWPANFTTRQVLRRDSHIFTLTLACYLDQHYSWLYKMEGSQMLSTEHLKARCIIYTKGQATHWRHAVTYINPENTMLSKRSQTSKTTYTIWFHFYEYLLQPNLETKQ